MNQGRHSSPSEMLLESLDEILFSARQCLDYRKTNSSIWPKPHAIGGTLGFPATLLLFSIVDTIGSYYDNLEVPCDGKRITIKPDKVKSHFYILNSHLFNLNLSEVDFEQIFSAIRNKLSHNSLIGGEILLHPGKKAPFIEAKSIRGKGRYTVYLNGFYEACESAINKFKIEMPTRVPSSFHGQKFYVKE
ncbi:hypothetical protein [Algoriphagus persicinus]|uniref:hypothetical protein n=1 Tax=Algoriphagus persicinus TaxID=3108754 RepID=UPI002B3EA42F|nr:hypothetical protein [Algoriphagus sp. E1-3-M2]MEB2786398.1 hypothetical protein [Algoriphagus sp. E1-3-M2]